MASRDERADRVGPRADMFPSVAQDFAMILLSRFVVLIERNSLRWLANSLLMLAALLVGLLHSQSANAGNAFGLDRGYTIVWSGWDPYVTAPNALRLETPCGTFAPSSVPDRGAQQQFSI